MIDFSKKPPLSHTQYESATCRFRQLIDHFDGLPYNKQSGDEYDRVKLVRFTFEYARSEESQGNFLQAFFEAAGTLIDEDPIEDDDDFGLGNATQRAALQGSINNFADYLFDNFFLPRTHRFVFCVFLGRLHPLTRVSWW